MPRDLESVRKTLEQSVLYPKQQRIKIEKVKRLSDGGKHVEVEARLLTDSECEMPAKGFLDKKRSPVGKLSQAFTREQPVLDVNQDYSESHELAQNCEDDAPFTGQDADTYQHANADLSSQRDKRHSEPRVSHKPDDDVRNNDMRMDQCDHRTSKLSCPRKVCNTDGTSKRGSSVSKRRSGDRTCQTKASNCDLLQQVSEYVVDHDQCHTDPEKSKGIKSVISPDGRKFSKLTEEQTPTIRRSCDEEDPQFFQGADENHDYDGLDGAARRLSSTSAGQFVTPKGTPYPSCDMDPPTRLEVEILPDRDMRAHHDNQRESIAMKRSSASPERFNIGTFDSDMALSNEEHAWNTKSDTDHIDDPDCARSSQSDTNSLSSESVVPLMFDGSTSVHDFAPEKTMRPSAVPEFRQDQRRRTKSLVSADPPMRHGPPAEYLPVTQKNMQPSSVAQVQHDQRRQAKAEPRASTTAKHGSSTSPEPRQSVSPPMTDEEQQYVISESRASTASKRGSCTSLEPRQSVRPSMTIEEQQHVSIGSKHESCASPEPRQSVGQAVTVEEQQYLTSEHRPSTDSRRGSCTSPEPRQSVRPSMSVEEQQCVTSEHRPSAASKHGSCTSPEPRQTLRQSLTVEEQQYATSKHQSSTTSKRRSSTSPESQQVTVHQPCTAARHGLSTAPELQYSGMSSMTVTGEHQASTASSRMSSTSPKPRQSVRQSTIVEEEEQEISENEPSTSSKRGSSTSPDSRLSVMSSMAVEQQPCVISENRSSTAVKHGSISPVEPRPSVGSSVSSQHQRAVTLEHRLSQMCEQRQSTALPERRPSIQPERNATENKDEYPTLLMQKTDRVSSLESQKEERSSFAGSQIQSTMSNAGIRPSQTGTQLQPLDDKTLEGRSSMYFSSQASQSMSQDDNEMDIVANPLFLSKAKHMHRRALCRFTRVGGESFMGADTTSGFSDQERNPVFNQYMESGHFIQMETTERAKVSLLLEQADLAMEDNSIAPIASQLQQDLSKILRDLSFQFATYVQALRDPGNKVLMIGGIPAALALLLRIVEVLDALIPGEEGGNTASRAVNCSPAPAQVSAHRDDTLVRAVVDAWSPRGFLPGVLHSLGGDAQAALTKVGMYTAASELCLHAAFATRIMTGWIPPLATTRPCDPFVTSGGSDILLNLVTTILKDMKDASGETLIGDVTTDRLVLLTLSLDSLRLMRFDTAGRRFMRRSTRSSTAGQSPVGPLAPCAVEALEVAADIRDNEVRGSWDCLKDHRQIAVDKTAQTSLRLLAALVDMPGSVPCSAPGRTARAVRKLLDSKPLTPAVCSGIYGLLCRKRSMRMWVTERDPGPDKEFANAMVEEEIACELVRGALRAIDEETAMASGRKSSAPRSSSMGVGPGRSSMESSTDLDECGVQICNAAARTVQLCSLYSDVEEIVQSLHGSLDKSELMAELRAKRDEVSGCEMPFSPQSRGLKLALAKLRRNMRCIVPYRKR